MMNVDMNDLIKCIFLDSRCIKWSIHMWSVKFVKETFLDIDSNAIDNTIFIEFLDLQHLINILNSYDYLPEDLRTYCIKFYKNRVFA